MSARALSRPVADWLEDVDGLLTKPLESGVDGSDVPNSSRSQGVQVHASLTVAPAVLSLRTRYRQEMNCQIVKDSIHTRPGWAMTYALGVDDTMAGFGTVAIAGPWAGKPTILEFYVLPEYRSRAFDLFEAFLEASGARLMEIQSS